MNTHGLAAREYTYRPRDTALERTSGFLWTLRGVLYMWLVMAFVLGGPVFRTAAVLGAVSIPLTDRAGFVRCLVALAGLSLGLLTGERFGLPVGLWGSRTLAIPLIFSLPAGIIGLGLLGFILGGRLGRWMSRPTRRFRYLYVANRSLGAVSGLGVGAVATILLVWTLAMYGPVMTHYCRGVEGEDPGKYPFLPIIRPMHRAHLWIMSDRATEPLARNNPMENSPAARRAAIIAEFAVTQHIYWKALADGELDEVLSDPDIQDRYLAARADPAIEQAIEDRDFTTILLSRHFEEALADDAFLDAVARHWPKLRRQVTERQIRLAQRVAEDLGPESRARFEQALREAEQREVDVSGF